jgi:hypothetical protein
LKMRRPLPVLILFALFLLSVLGAWAWFNVGTNTEAGSTADGQTPRIWLEARTNLAGYTFKPQSLSEEELQTLATTDIINGAFVPVSQSQIANRKSQILSPQSEISNLNSAITNSDLRPLTSEVRVFLATWRANSGKGLTVVHHTPDICWVGAGLKPVDMGQASQIELTFPVSEDRGQKSAISDQRSAVSDQKPRPLTSDLRPLTSSSRPPTSDLRPLVTIPFECRVFQSPDGSHRELVIWCTLIGGRILAEGDRFAGFFKQDKLNDPRSHERMAAPSRRLAANQLWRAIQDRLPARGVKQFVRCSVSLNGDWQSALEWVRSAALGCVVPEPIPARQIASR